jgi:hypothetical protein
LYRNQRHLNWTAAFGLQGESACNWPKRILIFKMLDEHTNKNQLEAM